MKNMRIILKNLADDVDALVCIENNDIISVLKSSEYEISTACDEIVFSVCYKRNFDIDIPSEETDRILRWLDFALGNLIVQIENTYRISNLSDGDVIELNDRWHYVPVTTRESFFKCLPSVYYLAQAECEHAKLESVSAVSFNEASYIKFYKKFLVLMNLSGWFKIIKYRAQLNRQKRISSQKCLTKVFSALYSMPLDEREYQFQPVKVIFDRIIDAMFSKIKMPQKLRIKLQKKIDFVRAELFGN